MDPLQVCEHAYKQQNYTWAEAFVCVCVCVLHNF